MILSEYNQVLEFVQKHHKFALFLSEEEKAKRKEEFPHLDEFGFNIKYVDSSYDSRFGDIWKVC